MSITVPGSAQEAAAQEAESESPDAILVTADLATDVGKLDVPLREQPQNVTVVPRARLDQFGRPRLQDLGYATVGLQATSLQYGAQSYGFFLRGFGGAPVILDGYYSSNNQFGSVGIIDMATVQSAEVLRGPAALLYGQGNPGGVVNLTSKAPRPAFGAEAFVNLDEHGGRRLEADVTGPLIGGIHARLIGVLEDSETFTPFIEHDRRLISPRIRAALGGIAELKLQYTYDDFRFTPDNGPGFNADLLADLPVGRSVQEANLPQARMVSQSFRGEVDARLAAGWKVRAGYYAQSSHPTRRLIEIDAEPTLFDTTIGRVVYSTIVPEHNGFNDSMFTVQLLGDFETGPLRHRLTVAGDYIRNRSKYDYAAYAFAPIDYRDPIYMSGPLILNPADLLYSGEGAFKSRVQAIYAQDLISLGAVKVLLGARHEKIETEGFADPAMTIPTGVPTEETRTTPRLGVVYDVDPRLTLYASYSQAFTPQYGLSRTNVPFEPEISRSYEAGLRRQFGDDMLLTAAVYDIRKRNILVVDPADINFNINAGIARSRGFEVELQGRVSDALRIGAGLAYTDAEIVESVDPVAFPEGDRLPAAAKWSALLNGTYTVQSGRLEGVAAGANVSYMGERPYMLPNTAPTLDAYTRLDLFVRYPLAQGLEVQLNLNNALDERILLANGYGRAQFDLPRTALLTVRWEMGSLAE